MVENNKLRKKFIKEALGTRNYFSYRTDLLLYKIMLSILVFLTIFFITADWNFSLLISAEVFIIFTLVNKLNITRKKDEGEEKYITRIKKEHFKKKIDEINPDDFEILIGFLFEKKGCKNFVKKGRHMFLAEKDGLISCIKIFKLFEDIELEKIDVRSMINFMCQNNIKIGHLVSTGNLSEEAKELLEKFKDKLNIDVVDLDGLYKLMEEHDILPNDDFFYNKAKEDKTNEKKKVIKTNIFDNKKIFVYILSSVFFYITSTIMPDNNISRYISYYFIILTFISLFYMIWLKYISNEA